MHPTIWHRLFAVATAVILGGSIVGPPRASAANITCGDTIVASTTLDADLSCIGTDAIRIGADNVTLDLGGHTVSGSAIGIGVTVNGRQNVTVRNGSIIGFFTGVWVENTGGSTLSNLVVTDTAGPAIYLTNSNGNHVTDVAVSNSAHNGISLVADSDENTVRNCTVHGAGFGVIVNGGSDGNTVSECNVSGSRSSAIFVGGGGGAAVSERNHVVGNIVHDNPTTGTAVAVFGGAQNELSGNTVSNNGCASDAACGFACEASSACGNTSHGIGLFAGTDQTIVAANRITLSRGRGIDISQSTGAQVFQNDVEGNGLAGTVGGNGILVSFGSSDSTVSGNTVAQNRGHGIQIARSASLASNANTVSNNQISSNGRFGISINDSGSNIVRGNSITANGTGTGDNGIFVGGVAASPGSNNTIVDNVVTGGTGTGIQLGTLAVGNTVHGNTVNGNARFGIGITSGTGTSSSSNTVRLNHVEGNGRGINLGTGASGNTVAWNVVTANKDAGLTANGSTALSLGNHIFGNAAFGNAVDPNAVVPSLFSPSLPFDIAEITPETQDMHDNYCVLGSPAAICVPRQPGSLATTVNALVVIDGLADFDAISPDVDDGLLDKISAAQGAFDRGQNNVVTNLLNALTNQVNAQTGKGISPPAADLFTSQTALVIGALP